MHVHRGRLQGGQSAKPRSNRGLGGLKPMASLGKKAGWGLQSVRDRLLQVVCIAKTQSSSTSLGPSEDFLQARTIPVHSPLPRQRTTSVRADPGRSVHGAPPTPPPRFQQRALRAAVSPSGHLVPLQ
jgi:hypothetical protein